MCWSKFCNHRNSYFENSLRRTASLLCRWLPCRPHRGAASGRCSDGSRSQSKSSLWCLEQKHQRSQTFLISKLNHPTGNNKNCHRAAADSSFQGQKEERLGTESFDGVPQRSDVVSGIEPGFGLDGSSLPGLRRRRASN